MNLSFNLQHAIKILCLHSISNRWCNCICKHSSQHKSDCVHCTHNFLCMLSSDAFIAFHDYYFGVSILVCYFLFFGCLTNGSGVGVSSVVFPCDSVSIFALTHCKCFLAFYLAASQYSLYISNHQPPSSRLFYFFICIISTAVADIAMNVANKTNTSITLSM